MTEWLILAPITATCLAVCAWSLWGCRGWWER